MVTSCSAYGCTNRWTKKGRQFHRFPLNEPERLKKWVAAMRRASWHPTRCSAICGDHFTDDSYKSKSRHFLKNDAVPSIFCFTKRLPKQEIIEENEIPEKSSESPEGVCGSENESTAPTDSQNDAHSSESTTQTSTNTVPPSHPRPKSQKILDNPSFIDDVALPENENVQTSTNTVSPSHPQPKSEEILDGASFIGDVAQPENENVQTSTNTVPLSHPRQKSKQPLDVAPFTDVITLSENENVQTSTNTTSPAHPRPKNKQVIDDVPFTDVVALSETENVICLQEPDSIDEFGKGVARKLRVLSNNQRIICVNIINAALHLAKRSKLTLSHTLCKIDPECYNFTFNASLQLNSQNINDSK